MTRRATTAEAIHLASLGVWLGAAGIAGVAAAVIFPTMRDLDPHLPGFAAYGGPHWLIAGGHAANKVFTIADLVQMACAVIAAVSYLVAHPPFRKTGRLLDLGRTVVITALMIVLLYRVLVLNPAMARDLETYWTAAREGNASVADPARAAFDAAHPTASRLMTATAVLLLLGLVLGVVAARSNKGRA